MKRTFIIILLLLFLGFVVALENTFSYAMAKKTYELKRERDSLEKVTADLRDRVTRLKTVSRIESLARDMGMKYVWEMGNVEIETLKIHVRPLDNPDSLLAVLLSNSPKRGAKSKSDLKNNDTSEKR